MKLIDVFKIFKIPKKRLFASLQCAIFFNFFRDVGIFVNEKSILKFSSFHYTTSVQIDSDAAAFFIDCFCFLNFRVDSKGVFSFLG